MSLVWGLLVMAAQIQCVDAARAGARAAARQDPAGSVLEVARATAPRGARGAGDDRQGGRPGITTAAARSSSASTPHHHLTHSGGHPTTSSTSHDWKARCADAWSGRTTSRCTSAQR
ncbi:TadE family type IV pilus minor pilin [Streptomyces sp. ME08-AFT2]|uniref:TadE family type IV pilus minor pilin n=1 Tax=Streptomyces sp. ME08-AFT2 TaxID=3028683 RepID=UPI0039F71F72